MRTALVTGGNSEIGFNIVESLFQKGWNLIILDTEKAIKALNEKVKVLKGRYNLNNTILLNTIDMYEDRDIEEKMEWILENHTLSLLINVAGINLLKSFLNFNKEDFEKVITINATNTLLISQAAAKNMIKHQNSGNIIFIGSQHGIVANYNRVPYSISKSILIHTTKSLALELSSFNIRVNCVSPTFIQTEENKDLLSQTYFKLNALEKIPLKKYGTAKDVKEAVLFLIDEKASMITGHNLVIDGGWTIQ